MPLSDHEQRMLEQIEQALYAEDPKFAQAVRNRDPRVHYRRRIGKAALGFVVGVCALMAGLIVNAGAVTIVVSVAGFLLMVACCVWALTSWKKMNGGAPAPAGPQVRRRRARAGFMERMEERWRRRGDEQR
ncbi:DUF3040 domain-containing protein [Actinomadura atramentaria]|uniref:DUF3040 domain-containing protein n=1 Tax=Actinomadura atramentaria TaxID=1990 RepID=UPI000A015B25|nr:DUF3040 domain-containing protein [Actinomadura atramentaria]